MRRMIPQSLRQRLGLRPRVEILPTPRELPAAAISPPGTVLATAPPALRPALRMLMPEPTNKQFDDGFKAMVAALQTYLPPAVAGLPDPAVFVASVTERAVGLGDLRAQATRGGFSVVDVKGGRLDATVRFQLWAESPSDAGVAIQDLSRRLLADRGKLKGSGFLRLAMNAVSLADNVPAVAANAWRDSVDFSVLYEYQFEESDADSLIASIPIRLHEQFDETTLVSDEMVRWDSDDAPRLSVRGPVTIVGISALSFVAGAAPTGSVTLERTFDGAGGTPVDHATLTEFLAGVATERAARIVFPSLDNFLGAIGAPGDPVTLGADAYRTREATFAVPIELPTVADRLEIRYQNVKFDQIAVVYLRAKR